MNQPRHAEHEDALVRAFIASQKQARWLDLLARPKRRRDLLKTLTDIKDLDCRFTSRIPPAQQSTAGILALLRSRGAPPECYLISERTALDARALPLVEALDAVVGAGFGTLVSCVPGRLGYFEGEGQGQRYLLERRTP
jgi:hypothetical protein